MADPVSGGLLVAGMGLQAFGTIQATKAQVSAATMDASFKELQAEQVLHSGVREQHLLDIQAQRLKGQQITAIAASGTELSGSNLLALEDTAAQAQDQSNAIRLDSQFRADQLRRSGAAEVDLANQRARAGLISLLGSVLVQGGKAYSTIADPNQGGSTFQGTAGYTAPNKPAPIYDPGFGLLPANFGIVNSGIPY